MNKRIKICLTNLGKYHEDECIEEWIELPISEESLKKVLENIGINEKYKEYFISDFKTDVKGLKINEDNNIKQLNQLVKKIEELEINEIKQLEVLLEGSYIKTNTILENDISNLLKENDFILLEDEDSISNEAKLANSFIKHLGGINMLDLETLEKYFDYEKYGEHLIAKGAYIASNNYVKIQL
ncbi:antirestriction protein ArdA [Clostridioides difficile]|uniref:antirestriction protein ArdA n=1 Tax=Clostridioides difficile TaxID=1496 RepID=UPI000D1ED1E9|nr:antirestriction protein ArdA [Clostridioides difficile]HBE9444691.1 antirestriction protein ArdA [Clostridioides difficile]